jgi:hypothetical protein
MNKRPVAACELATWTGEAHWMWVIRTFPIDRILPDRWGIGTLWGDLTRVRAILNQPSEDAALRPHRPSTGRVSAV